MHRGTIVFLRKWYQATVLQFRGSRKTPPMGKKPNPYYCLRILSHDPLITISGCQTDDIFMKLMADDMPEVFGREFGLHLLLPTWNVEAGRSQQIKDAIKAASERMPGHVFVVVSSTEYETFLLGQENVPTLFTHQAIFVDDETWKPSEQKFENLGTFDSVMNARFDKAKRHELAAEIKKLLLIYAYSLDETVAESTQRIKGILPQAYFANHEFKKGEYSPLSRAEIIRFYGHARVGLCLSAEEGYSRASIEYLMCGLPVVSTKSIGGRDRYYSEKYCRIVEADKQAVEAAVHELKEQNFSREEIREHVVTLLNFDRENFLRSVNRMVEHFTGLRDFFGSMSPFLGIKLEFIPHTKIVQKLKQDQAV
jgi:glycosyltransferase involved in cell wall biosynthesis